ncbi:ketopantoate reductase family protein [Ornithinibacillus contaminans]|uniref:ketopantoate reductase family protein n=1 Tax=Ornithinibacillus contaminans TaxID=694055 RepID=UPI00064E131B|nr:2-dehydropantoate 2-reductase [Ornithinibacillus contaminans]
MKLLILGAGAMGSLFAGKLKQNGVDVTIYNRSNNHVEKIQSDGLKIIDKEGVGSTVQLPVLTDPVQVVDTYDLILVFVKTFATENVLDKVLPYITKETPILTLQNGIGNMEKISKLAPEHEVLVGGTWAGASVAEPGTILHRAWGSTFIGAPLANERKNDLLMKIASTFTKSGLETEVAANVQSIIWSKLLVNIAFNGLTAITRLKNGDAIRTQEGKMIVEKLVDETVEIAAKKAIPLLFENPYAECIRLGETDIAMNTSSMLADILHKRKTEIEAINGAIVEEGRKYGINTPYNEMIVNVIKVIEESYRNMVE